MPTTLKHPSKPLERALAKSLTPTYDIHKSYEWNYRQGPLFRGPYPPERKVRRKFKLLDFELNSPLGIAAGPLLNSNWIRAYAKLGFDILSYKTVRTRKRPSNSAPNCVFVDAKGPLTDDRLKEILYTRLQTPDRIDEISITNSFGVPSRNPSIWQADVERAKGSIEKGQILIVSVMGSSEYYPEREAFIQDFALCAELAKEAGADVVELDLSCPNSTAEEGMVYLDPKLSGEIVRKVKARIGETPLFIKVGNFNPNRWDRLRDLLKTGAAYISGIAGINTVKMTVMADDGKPALPGRPQSGVCGAAIKDSALQFIRWIAEERRRNKYQFSLIGVGGIMTPADIDQSLNSGADAVEVATAAMWIRIWPIVIIYSIPDLMPAKALITLLTDFGTADAFVAGMKGVILDINPDTTIVDITHEIPPYGIRPAAFVIKSVYPYFPKGTIHVVVVDPGVGGQRNPLLVVHPRGCFIGPDNGVFSYLYKEKTQLHTYRLNNPRYRLTKYSPTFDGRDLFAPVAAWLSKKIAPAKLGQRVKDYVTFPVPEPRKLKDRRLQGQVVHIDRFGNLITNITLKTIKPWIAGKKIPSIMIGGRTIKGLKQFYAQAGPGELGALINSDGHLEIFCNRTGARSFLNASDEEIVTVR